jgi:uncharacterized protein YqkB
LEEKCNHKLKQKIKQSRQHYDTIHHMPQRGALNMEITITAAAADKIAEKINGRTGFLKLKYDMEGCGCAVDGVAALWFVPEVEDTDIAIETNNQTLYVEKSKMVFFDEQMTIDFSESTQWFQLKSPQQILNGQLSLIIKKNTD